MGGRGRCGSYEETIKLYYLKTVRIFPSWISWTLEIFPHGSCSGSWSGGITQVGSRRAAAGWWGPSLVTSTESSSSSVVLGMESRRAWISHPQPLSPTPTILSVLSLPCYLDFSFFFEFVDVEGFPWDELLLTSVCFGNTYF